MKYFSPSYWFQMWVLSAPLFNYKNESIYAKSIDNQNIKDWASNNANLQLRENQDLNLSNNQKIKFQNNVNISSSKNFETDNSYENFLKKQGWSNNPESAHQQIIEIQEEHHNFLKQEHRKKREEIHHYDQKLHNPNNDNEDNEDNDYNDDDVDIFEIRYSYFGSLNRIYSPNFLTGSSLVPFTDMVIENGENFFYDFNFLTILEGILRNNRVININLIQNSDNVYINVPLHYQVATFNFNFYRENNPNQHIQQYREFQMALYSIFISRHIDNIEEGIIAYNPFNNIFLINNFANQLINRFNMNPVNYRRLISNINLCFFPMPPSRNDILSSLGLNNNIFNNNIRNRITSVINHMRIEFERQFSRYLHFFVSVNLNQRLPFIFRSTLRNLVRRNVRRTRTDPANERRRVVELFYPGSISNGVQYDNLNYFIITDVTNVNNNDFHNVFYRVYNPEDHCYYHLLSSDILNANNSGISQFDFFFTVPENFNLHDYRIRNENINIENLGENIETMTNFLLLRTDFPIWMSILLDQLRISIENNLNIENIIFGEWQRTCRNTNRNRRNINFNNYNQEKWCKLKNSIPWKEYILNKHNEIYNILNISKENKIIWTNKGVFIGNLQENIWTQIENKEKLKYQNIFLNKNDENFIYLHDENNNFYLIDINNKDYIQLKINLNFITNTSFQKILDLIHKEKNNLKKNILINEIIFLDNSKTFWIKNKNDCKFYELDLINKMIITINEIESCNLNRELKIYYDQENNKKEKIIANNWNEYHQNLKIFTFNLRNISPLNYKKIEFLGNQESFNQSRISWGDTPYYVESPLYKFNGQKIVDIITNTNLKFDKEHNHWNSDNCKIILQDKKTEETWHSNIAWRMLMCLSFYYENNNYYLQIAIEQYGKSNTFSLWSEGGSLFTAIGNGIKLYNYDYENNISDNITLFFNSDNKKEIVKTLDWSSNKNCYQNTLIKNFNLDQINPFDFKKIEFLGNQESFNQSRINWGDTSYYVESPLYKFNGQKISNVVVNHKNYIQNDSCTNTINDNFKINLQKYKSETSNIISWLDWSQSIALVAFFDKKQWNLNIFTSQYIHSDSLISGTSFINLGYGIKLYNDYIDPNLSNDIYFIQKNNFHENKKSVINFSKLDNNAINFINSEKDKKIDKQDKRIIIDL